MSQDYTKFAALRKQHLTELAELIRKIDTRNSVGFQLIMDSAFNHYGLVRSGIHIDLCIHQSSITRWSRGQATPSAPTRKAVKEWILAELDNLTQ